MTLYNTFGYNTEHKGKSVRHIIGGEAFDSMFINLAADPGGSYVRVPATWNGRVDLISNAVYGTPDLWGYIMMANGISDPFEVKGDTILKIPIIG